MTDPLEHILRLAFEIGRRPATGEGERRAAAYVREQLEKFGFSVKTEPVRAARSTTPILVLILLLSIVGVVVALVVGLVALGLLISGIALVLFLGEATTALKLVSPLMPKARSQNVVARLAPKELPRRRLIICAHYDSPKPDLLWRPGRVRLRRPALMLLTLSLVLIPLLLAMAAAVDIPILALATLPFVLLVLAALLLLLQREVAYKHVAGANGNASGVAVMLTLCEAISVDQPADTEVMALATGAHESGLAGMQAFIAKHSDELGRAWMLNIDSVGGGPVFYTTSEGLLLKHPTSKELREVAEKVSALPGLDVEGRAFRLVSTEIEPVLLRRLDALSVMAGADGRPSNWHWKTDTVENVDPDSIDTAYRFLEAMVRRLITQ